MTSNQHRKRNGVHLNRSQRKRIRQQLINVYGNLCCWCDNPMELPGPGKDITNYSDMATIEHYYAKKMGQPNNVMLFRLAHEKCNK